MTEIKRAQPQLPDEWPELRKAKASAKTAWAWELTPDTSHSSKK